MDTEKNTLPLSHAPSSAAPTIALNNLPGFDLSNTIAMLGNNELIIQLMEIFYQNSVDTQADIEANISK